jgi:N-formylglutamate deformylase
MTAEGECIDGVEPFQVERHGERPVIVLHVPHAGTVIPDQARRSIVLDDDELGAELVAMTDWHTDRIAREAVRRSGVDAVLFVNRLSRLVVDPERFPDDREPMNAVGMGAVYHRTSSGGQLRRADPERDHAMRARWFHPYADALADLVDDVRSLTGRVTIIDLHSYPERPLPYELDHDAARPGVCIGVDSVHTPDALVEVMRSSWVGVRGGVASNTPFAGTYVPLRHYGHDTRVRSVMVEIRRDVYLDEATSELHEGFEEIIARLATALVQIANSR